MRSVFNNLEIEPASNEPQPETKPVALPLGQSDAFDEFMGWVLAVILRWQSYLPV